MKSTRNHNNEMRILGQFILLLCFISCSNKSNGRFWGALEEMGYPMQADSVNLVEMDESVFGEAIPLKGEYVIIDPIIMPAEMQAFIKDDLFFLKHLERQGGEPSLHVLKLPSMDVVAELAKRGNGPAEVIDTRLIQTTDSDKYCFIHDVNKDLLYYIDKEFKFHPFHRNIVPENAKGINIGSEGAVHLGENDFLFTQMADNGMGIIKIDFSDMMAKGIINLNCSDDLDRSWEADWTCFVGISCSNLDSRRLAYAYNYYHRILFSDFDGKNIKVVQFKEQEPFKTPGMWEHMNTGQDVFYYQTAFGSSNYAYFVYKGSSFADKQELPVYLEQWTWDGKPVKRFELEKGMYPLGGCVDEKTSTLYLLDVTKDDFIYKVQMEGEIL